MVFRDNKSIFWTDNTTGDLLHKILQELVAAEVLELDEEQDKVRLEINGSYNFAH